ncbi:MAG: HAD family phosphatase [Gammaproteobacteria bacterium]|nr:HAD family phosphatase [Gammaproteobacteria bacterium]
MTFKAIIFDFDGILFDSEKLHLQACNKVFETLGFTISDDEYFQKYVGLADNEMFESIFNNKKISCSTEQSKLYRIRKIQEYQKIIREIKSLEGVEGAREFLESHSKSINNFAICSCATRVEIDATLNLLEGGSLKKYFKLITTKDDINEGKPSPEGYLLTADRLNISPNNCLAIEDTPIGIAAAKSAGMKVAALTTTHNSSSLTNADFIADHYNKIDAWIKSLMNNVA